jgi:hypothetical protein
MVADRTKRAGLLQARWNLLRNWLAIVAEQFLQRDFVDWLLEADRKLKSILRKLEMPDQKVTYSTKHPKDYSGIQFAVQISSRATAIVNFVDRNLR